MFIVSQLFLYVRVFIVSLLFLYVRMFIVSRLFFYMSECSLYHYIFYMSECSLYHYFFLYVKVWLYHYFFMSECSLQSDRSEHTVVKGIYRKSWKQCKCNFIQDTAMAIPKTTNFYACGNWWWCLFMTGVWISASVVVKVNLLPHKLQVTERWRRWKDSHCCHSQSETASSQIMHTPLLCDHNCQLQGQS